MKNGSSPKDAPKRKTAKMSRLRTVHDWPSAGTWKNRWKRTRNGSPDTTHGSRRLRVWRMRSSIPMPTPDTGGARAGGV